MFRGAEWSSSDGRITSSNKGQSDVFLCVRTCLKRLLVMGHVIVGYARSLAMLSSITQPELRSITAGCVVISFCETWQRKRTSARFAFAT